MSLMTVHISQGLLTTLIRQNLKSRRSHLESRRRGEDLAILNLCCRITNQMPIKGELTMWIFH